MESANALHRLWQELERNVNEEHSMTFDLDAIQALLSAVEKEKERMESEQMISRHMYQRNYGSAPAYVLEKEKEALRRKFRYLTLYFYRHNDYRNFGKVVTMSIIREWPVTISYAERGQEDTYTWDRAPLSVAQNERKIRKDRDTYVMRVLALEEQDIGMTLMRARHWTEPQIIGENGKEIRPEDLPFVTELQKEGEGRKREAPHDGLRTARRTRRAYGEERVENKKDHFFYDGFQHYDSGIAGELLGFISYAGKKKEDYSIASGDSNNVAFSIRNISIVDPSVRETTKRKYLLQSHFEFTFVDVDKKLFIVRTADYECPVRSMPLEASTNNSTHWTNSMPGIWIILHEYYGRLGEQTEAEMKSWSNLEEDQLGDLEWGHVKGMVSNFLACRSDLHIRPFTENEMRTVSRMILARRLANVHYEEGSEHWKLNDPKEPEEQRNAVLAQYEYDGLFIRPGNTFTQALNRRFSISTLNDKVMITIYDFTGKKLDLSDPQPSTSPDTLYTWLYGVSELILGQFLHANVKLSVEMFNRKIITLITAESAEKTIDKLVNDCRVRNQPSGMLMLRVDERDNCSLMLHHINPASNRPSLFGTVNAKTLKDHKVSLSPTVSAIKRAAAIRDGIVCPKDKKMRGLYAYLKTGYNRGFARVVQVDENGGVIACGLYKRKEDSMNAVYPYDLEPAEMRVNEINPIIGPITAAELSSAKDEKFSIPETITKSIAELTLSSTPSSSTTSSPKPAPKKKATRKKPEAMQSAPSTSIGQPMQPRRVQQMALVQGSLQFPPPMAPMHQTTHSHPDQHLYPSHAHPVQPCNPGPPPPMRSAHYVPQATTMEQQPRSLEHMHPPSMRPAQQFQQLQQLHQEMPTHHAHQSMMVHETLPEPYREVQMQPRVQATHLPSISDMMDTQHGLQPLPVVPQQVHHHVHNHYHLQPAQVEHGQGMNGYLHESNASLASLQHLGQDSMNDALSDHPQF